MKHHEVKPYSGMHFVQMLKNFADNEDYINAHNVKPHVTYQLGHNAFSGMSYEEWKEHVRVGAVGWVTMTSCVLPSWVKIKSKVKTKTSN